MCTVTLEIDEKSKEAKDFLHYVEEFAHTNDAVNIAYEPNEETLKSFEAVKNGDFYEAKDAEDLFRYLKS